MKYRINKKTGDKISEIGLGSAYMYEEGMKESVKALHLAYEGGINNYDLAAGHGDAFPIYGEAFKDVRKNIFYQIHFKMSGKCVYCNHCKPCPQDIDIGLVNKYYDLAVVGDDMAKSHYKNLEKNANDCIKCGHCDSRCPFSVKQSERMTKINEYFKNKKV